MIPVGRSRWLPVGFDDLQSVRDGTWAQSWKVAMLRDSFPSPTTFRMILHFILSVQPNRHIRRRPVFRRFCAQAFLAAKIFELEPRSKSPEMKGTGKKGEGGNLNCLLPLLSVLHSVVCIRGSPINVSGQKQLRPLCESSDISLICFR